MFYETMYQTGELDAVAAEMEKGSVPCLDVLDREEYGWVLEQLDEKGVARRKDIPEDKNAQGQAQRA